jgi:hypothetical protein
VTRTEKLNRLEELRKDRELASQALRDIAAGKKQSYGVGTRNATAYSMTIGELRAWRKQLDQEISELERELTGRGRRHYINFRPTY